MTHPAGPLRAEIIALRWFHGGAAFWPLNAEWTIGFAALLDEDGDGRYFEVYVGPVPPGDGHGRDEKTDAAFIAMTGTPIMDETMARHLAPMCADRQYRM